MITRVGNVQRGLDAGDARSDHQCGWLVRAPIGSPCSEYSGVVSSYHTIRTLQLRRMKGSATSSISLLSKKFI